MVGAAQLQSFVNQTCAGSTRIVSLRTQSMAYQARLAFE